VVASCTDAGGGRDDAPITVLHRMTEVDALAALSARAEELAGTDEFSGAVLVARDGGVLFQDAWGLADREAGTPNTSETRSVSAR